jgi:hypothetical protein
VDRPDSAIDLGIRRSIDEGVTGPDKELIQTRPTMSAGQKYLVEFELPSDEAAGGRPQIPRTGIQCPQ